MAQDATFQASVDKNPVGLNDQLTLSFSLSSSGTAGGKNLQLPDLNKFRIMSGPNQSSSMQFINGAVSSSVVYSYVLQPKEIGKFTIGIRLDRGRRKDLSFESHSDRGCERLPQAEATGCRAR